MAYPDSSLRTGFDSVAERYDRARPAHPARLIADVLHLSGADHGDRVLEVGSGTGIATQQLAESGLRVTCIELGHDLASVARRRLARHPGVDIVVADFETWEPPPETEPFDLVVAAASWHWIDPEIRYAKAWRLLRPGGHLVFWSTGQIFPLDGDPFFEELRPVYDELGEGAADGPARLRPGELPDARDELTRTGLFGDVAVRHYDWEVLYDADAYIDLLGTFSRHIAMAPRKRDRLFAEIRRRLAARPDRSVRFHWDAVLHVARRVS